jgi:hypothetical protein
MTRATNTDGERLTFDSHWETLPLERRVDEQALHTAPQSVSRCPWLAVRGAASYRHLSSV